MAAKEKAQNCDVLVSGGGVPGLVLALLLGDLGLRVTVIDPHPPAPADRIQPDGRTAALMASSVNILKSARLWADLQPHGAALETLRIIDGTTRADFHAADIDQEFFGINMPNTLMRALLAARARDHRGVTLITPATIESFTIDDLGVDAALTDGSSIRARMIVGADGRESVTRHIAGIECTARDYGQNAITLLIEHSRDHDNISTEFHRPGGPFTLVPLPGKMSSVVWVEYAADADQFMTLRLPDFEQAVQDRTETLLGKITLRTNPSAWPLKLMRAKSLTAPRLALVAEAAHILHPLGAQGLNLSLRDVATLAEEIADAARCGLDIGSRSVLDRYEFRRRADITTRSLGTDGLNRMVSNDLSILRLLRGAGLRTVEGLAPLRRFAMNEGITPGYDDSRLSRGLPL